MIKVTSEGQIKKGDKLKITGKSSRDDQVVTAKEIITSSGKEEIIINKKKNYYFITKMLIAGESWARKVEVLK